MLALQVAAGIVLAYVIIVNQDRFLKFGKWLLSAVLAFTFFAVIGWGSSAAYSSLSPRFGPFLTKLGQLAGALAMLGCIAAGGAGLIWMMHEAFKRPSIYFSNPLWFLAAATNTIMILGVDWLLSLTFVGPWIDSVDHWSRSSGYADAGSIGLFSMSCLWPFGVIAGLRLARGGFVVREFIDGSAEKQEG